MIKKLYLMNIAAAVASCKTLLVPIDYDYTLDVYYNFKNNPSIVVSPVSEGIQVYIPDQWSNSTVNQKRAFSECSALSDGMIVLNIDNTEENTLITWDQYDVFHLIDPSNGEELQYNSVIQQDCSNELATTTLGVPATTASDLISTSTAASSYYVSYDSDVESYIGTVLASNLANYTTYVPLQYSNQSSTETLLTTNSLGSTETILQLQSTQSTTYGPSNTLALVAPARFTTKTSTSYTSGSTYTVVSTITSCQNHAMGGCVVETVTQELVGGVSSSSSAQTSSSASTSDLVLKSSLITVSSVSGDATKTLTYKTSSSTATPGITSSYRDSAVESLKGKSFVVVFLALLVNFMI